MRSIFYSLVTLLLVSCATNEQSNEASDIEVKGLRGTIQLNEPIQKDGVEIRKIAIKDDNAYYIDQSGRTNSVKKIELPNVKIKK
jgi:hypothetical protein